MTSPDPTVDALVTRLRSLGFGAPPADGAITLDKLAPEVLAQLGGGGGSLVEDPPGSGLFSPSSAGLTEDPNNPGLYLI